MKRHRDDTGFVERLLFRNWPSLRRQLAIGLLLFLCFGQNQTHAAAFPASEASTAHVYLLRGVLNIFSLGLDDIAAKLRAQGIPVTVDLLNAGVNTGDARGGRA